MVTLKISLAGSSTLKDLQSREPCDINQKNSSPSDLEMGQREGGAGGIETSSCADYEPLGDTPMSNSHTARSQSRTIYVAETFCPNGL